MYGYGPTIVELQRYAARADRDVVRMVSGRPDWDPPDALRGGLREYADAGAEAFQYPPPAGLRELREALSDHGPGADPEEVVVTAGTVEANHLAVSRAFERGAGDVALIPDPGYPYYAARVRMLGGEVRRVPVGADGRLDPQNVRKRADDDVGVILCNSPNNPTGAVYPADTVESLVIVAEDCDAVLVSDEVYARLDRSGAFASALSVDSQRRIVTGGVSKSLAATGLRIGFAVVPTELRAAFEMRHVLTTIAASRPAQRAALRALRETDESYYRRARQRLGDRADRLLGALEAAGAECIDPGGGMYVFARLPGFAGTGAGARRLVDEAGVAAMPGTAFGDSFADWMRFSLTTPRIDEAADRLSTLGTG